MRPGVMYNQGPGNMGGGQGTPTTKPPPPQFMGGQGGGISQLFNPGGSGATQQGQSQMITGGQYPGMQGQPGGPRNTLPYSPGGPGMGQFGAL